MSRPAAGTAAYDNSASKKLDSAIADWHNCSTQLLEKLHKLKLFTLRDVLFHLPLRYIDKTRITAIADLNHGDEALVEGTICDSAIRYYGKKRGLAATLTDSTGQLNLRFFNLYRGQQERFRHGARMRCYGQVRGYRGGVFEMVHPECSTAINAALEESLTPVYPSTDKLQQRSLRQLTGKALSIIAKSGNMRVLPEYTRDGSKASLPAIENDLRFIHRPPPGTDLMQLQDGTLPQVQRLAFEELLAYRLALMQRRGKAREFAAMAVHGDIGKKARFINKLPFTLTTAQQQAIDVICSDLARTIPMQRLLQGDVGAGKTVVAAVAVLDTVNSGYSACIMAPTELLAQQHYQTMQELFAASGDNYELVLLTGRLTTAQRRDSRQRLSSDIPCIVIGTHALIQEGVKITNLGLVVIDEQHRFGVHQRLGLLQSGDNAQVRPHQLIMTATPIPRTLAMTIYADLDISILDSLPKGRKATRTTVLNSQRRDEIISRVLVQCQQKRQVYWVCSLIDESEQLQKQAAVTTFEFLTKKLPKVRTELIHGRLGTARKDQVMKSFIAGEIDLLVATTVIEVGIDVPNANLMVIENAERLGLAQLHQLRGRVGRGLEHSDCVLLYDNPISNIARQRLEIMKQSNDGFVIAEKDLLLRGAGEVFGLRQKGLPETRIANFARDKNMLPDIVKVAERLLATDQDMAAEVISRWQAGRIHYSDA